MKQDHLHLSAEHRKPSKLPVPGTPNSSKIPVMRDVSGAFEQGILTSVQDDSETPHHRKLWKTDYI